MPNESGPRPWDPLLDLEREFRRLFASVGFMAAGRLARTYPPLGLYESPDAYFVTVELPGEEPEGLDLSIEGETLTLRGDRQPPEGVAEDRYRRRERPFGRWSRSLTLPRRIDTEAVTASFSRGVLTVRLPKAAEQKPRQISVSEEPDRREQA